MVAPSRAIVYNKAAWCCTCCGSHARRRCVLLGRAAVLYQLTGTRSGPKISGPPREQESAEPQFGRDAGSTRQRCRKSPSASAWTPIRRVPWHCFWFTQTGDLFDLPVMVARLRRRHQRRRRRSSDRQTTEIPVRLRGRCGPHPSARKTSPWPKLLRPGAGELGNMAGGAAKRLASQRVGAARLVGQSDGGRGRNPPNPTSRVPNFRLRPISQFPIPDSQTRIETYGIRR